MELEHKPVLLQEILDYLNCKKEGIYFDGTLGRGGHTEAILHKIGSEGRLIAVDRDKTAINVVKNKFNDFSNLTLIHENFINLDQVLDQLQIDKVDGMIFDLGFSSPQVDDPKRGFSYQREGPLDMRMNKHQKLTAADIVNGYKKEEIVEIIKKYGEERWAARIGNFIIKRRKNNPINTTKDLVKIIKNAIPAGARRKGGHPAKRTFQALRIATNDELNQLEKMITQAVNRLKPGGRVCIISFHSLEDRIVKNTFRYLAKSCTCPPDFPICACDKESEVNIITKKPIEASQEEIETNRRARSAKLRVAERVLN
jgi:16S rRNA (cytosine1402-N4)-methyltransferase